jgi:hypothetical protein
VAAVLCAAAVLTACASAPVPDDLPRLSGQDEDGWSRVDVGGRVHAIAGLDSGSPPPHLLAAGEDDGAPVLVDVTDGQAREVPAPAEGGWTPPDGGYDAVGSNGDLISVVGRADPSAVLLHSEWLAYPAQRLADAQGREVSWVSPLLDGEENLRAIGVVEAGDGWHVHAWQAYGDEEWMPLDRGEQLRVLAEPGPRTVLTGTTETTVVVAGAVADESGRPGVWSLYDDPTETGGRWTHHPTATEPDAFTDVAYWDLGWWVAGHRDGRPVVYEFDDPGQGSALPVPDTELDPDHPVVIVAGIPVGQPMVLATQSVDGPALWVGGAGGWERTAVPAGRLSSAQRVGGGLYVVVDGALWFRPLPASARPS